MDIEKFIQDWIAVSNAYDTEAYLGMYHKSAVLDDPSVGRAFNGHAGIREYFEDYFIGYRTRTKITSLHVTGPDTAHLEVEFTGEFPEGVIGGVFDFTFSEGKIAAVTAALLQ